MVDSNLLSCSMLRYNKSTFNTKDKDNKYNPTISLLLSVLLFPFSLNLSLVSVLTSYFLHRPTLVSSPRLTWGVSWVSGPMMSYDQGIPHLWFEEFKKQGTRHLSFKDGMGSESQEIFYASLRWLVIDSPTTFPSSGTMSLLNEKPVEFIFLVPYPDRKGTLYCGLRD